MKLSTVQKVEIPFHKLFVQLLTEQQKYEKKFISLASDLVFGKIKQNEYNVAYNKLVDQIFDNAKKIVKVDEIDCVDNGELTNFLKPYEWYENIQPNIRELVFQLRNNGINTTCSCEHQWFVECETCQADDVDVIRNILFDLGFDNYGFKIVREQIVNNKQNTDHIYVDLYTNRNVPNCQEQNEK